jgi:glutathione S-transferase
VFGASFDADEVIGRAQRHPQNHRDELSDQSWIAASHATIADLALYSYIARAPEGSVDLAGYPNARSWLSRIEALRRVFPFHKTPVGLWANP